MSFSTSRIAAGLTLEEVSKDFGVSSAAVRDWEEGKAQPPLHVSRALDVIQGFGATYVGELAAATEPVTPAKHPSRAIRTSRKRSNVAPASLIRSKKRVADHGEVFTPPWLVEKMLDLVKGETERIDSRFLEPACGSGNFLVPILQRKLAAVEAKYGKNAFEKHHYALLALTCCYGIELLADNIAECRANMLEVFAQYLGLTGEDELYRAASHVLSLNLIHGDAMTMKNADGGPILIVEWGYIGKGKFQRRDFRLDVLTGMASFHEEQSLFSNLGRHEIFKPAESYPPMNVRELAARDAA
jgi:transcriptional regulator with XRE-family HTH domain